jgi:ATP-binding cassette subfamily B (MDR/TAP) protein 1
MGSIGALLTGGVYPAWGVMFGLMIELLFHPVMKCSEETVSLLGPYETCSAYWRNESSYMKAMSEELSIYWSIVLVACIVGHVMVFVGYGMESERLNKRVRDGVFKGCVRQEIGFFDKIPVTTLLTQLQSDSAKIHAFSGQPIRIFLINVSSVLCGLLIAFIYAWPFALVAIAIIPLMGFATAMEMKLFLGEDNSTTSETNPSSQSSAGIVLETLRNIKTISSCTMEEYKLGQVIKLLKEECGYSWKKMLVVGSGQGFSMLIQQWVNALLFWWGGYLIVNYPNIFKFHDFLIAMFSLLFALFALGASSIGSVEKKEAELATGRVFYLMDRKSEIDPLEDENEKMEV